MKILKTSGKHDRPTILTGHSHHSAGNMLPMNVIFQCPVQVGYQSMITHDLLPRG
jgi:hypothetical protein